MKESIELKIILEAEPSAIYESWLSSEGHSKMTGGEALCSNIEGDKFSAWDGYISGSNLALTPSREIVQSWRTSEFEEEDEDSLLKIVLSEVENGTELRLIHTNIPEGQTQYEKGWTDHYFTPMKQYFANL